jgi:hypothetical protein
MIAPKDFKPGQVWRDGSSMYFITKRTRTTVTIQWINKDVLDSDLLTFSIKNDIFHFIEDEYVRELTELEKELL